MARKTHFNGAKAVVVALATLFVTVGAPAPAEAQAPAAAGGPSSLSVSPPTVELDAQPGQTLKQKIGIDNGSDEARNISVQVQNFAARGETGQADLTDESTPYSLSQWVKVSPTTAQIPAKEHQDFEVEIKIPANAPPGGHFGAVVFSPGAPNAPDANVKVISQVTSLLLLRIPGNATEKATVESFVACKPSESEPSCESADGFFQKGPVRFTVRVKNSGNVQVKPEGTITIYNMFGSKVETLKIEPRNVLPDSTRRFDVDWKQKQIFGQYKAKLELKYGTSPQDLKSETTVTGAPLVTLLIVGLVLLAVFLLFWLPRKRLKKAFKALAASGDD